MISRNAAKFSSTKSTKTQTKLTTLVTENQDILYQDQDIHPSSAKRYAKDLEERQKYLNYKSVTGIDTVPRIREPTPPGKQNKNDYVD